MSKLHPETKLEFEDRNFNNIDAFSFQNSIGRYDFTVYETRFDDIYDNIGRMKPYIPYFLRSKSNIFG